MIPYITSFLAMITCLLAWFLGIFNKLSDSKLLERRKLNLLIYNLLELKFWVEKEVLLDTKLNELLNHFWEQIHLSIDNLNNEIKESSRETLLKGIKEAFRGGVEIPALEGSVDELIKELAEVDPIFAFELNGKYQISSQLKNGCILMASLVGQDVQTGKKPEAIVDLILQPQILRELHKDLKINLPLIAKRAGRRFYRQYLKLDVPYSVDINVEEVKFFIDNMLRQLAVNKSSTAAASSE